MILQGALLVLVASAFQAATPEPTTAAVLLPDNGLSDEQILELAIPDYPKRSALSKAHEKDNLNEYQFTASVVAARITDLGFGDRPFLVAVVAVTDGYCNCCHDGRLVVIEMPSKRVVWNAKTAGAVGPNWIDNPSEQMRLFHIFPDDAALTVAVSSSSPCGGLQIGGSGQESWYRPRRPNGGGFKLETVWEGELEYGDSGMRGGGWAGGCAEIRSLWPRRAYKYVVHDLAGWIDKTPTSRSPLTEIERPCKNADDNFGAVDFVSTNLLTLGEISAGLGANVAPKLERRNLRPTVTFPFNLPVRHLFVDANRLPAATTSERHREVQSPDGALMARFQNKRQDRDVLEIRRASDATLLRQLPAPEWVDNARRPNEYGDYSFPSVGWSRDGHRCLAVVEVGGRFGPVLVSLTADGKGDTWEGLLPKDKADLGDGFIFDLPEAKLTPDSESTDHR